MNWKFWKKKKDEYQGMTWYNVTVEQYQKMKGIDFQDFDGQVEVATILLGIDADDMTWADFCQELKKLEFLSKPIPQTIVRNSYVLNGRKYDCLYNLQDMSVTRYMDYLELVKTNDLVKVLTVFLIPEGKKYGEYDRKQVEEDIRTMNVVDANGIVFFFKLTFTVCIKVLKDYSVKNLKGNPELQKVVSELMDYYCMLGQ